MSLTASIPARLSEKTGDASPAIMAYTQPSAERSPPLLPNPLQGSGVQLPPQLPASWCTRDQPNGPFSLVPGVVDHIKDDLSVAKLNRIHDWLSLAGLPMPPRPLNYHRSRFRSIIPCEQTSLHIVWAPGYIFLKPLPSYLLDEYFWDDHLVQDEELYQLALGFLRSYVALIQYPSDLTIARSAGLVPDELQWDDWVATVSAVLKTTPTVNRRYNYGELRLSRLNKICWARGEPRGYHFPYQTYGEMFKAHIAPIAGATVYVALALTAMQVGLATRQLGDSAAFHRASYGFTVFAIVAPVGLVGIVAGLVLVFFAFNALYAVLFRRRKHSRSLDVPTS